MKAQVILACAAAGVAISAFNGAPASAERSTGSIGFSSDVVKAGDSVEIFGTCEDPAFTTAPVISSILNAPDLYGRDVGTGKKELISHATVKKDAKPGKYKVSYKCGGDLVSGDLWVGGTAKPGVSVIPAKARAGQQVSVRVDCEQAVPVSSAALAVGKLAEGEGRPDQRHFVANAKVKNVKPGAYKVTAKCNGKTVSTILTVLGASNVTGQVPVKPKGAAETGDLANA